MEYILISVLTILVTTFLVYKIANRIFNIPLRKKSLILCAACALFISLVLPRIVAGVTGLLGTLIILALFAVLFAYFIAYYDNHDQSSPVAEIPVEKGLTDEKVATVEITEGPLPNKNALTPQEQDTFIQANLNGQEVAVSSASVQSDLGDRPLSDALDDLLDYAFQQKEAGNLSLALKYFQQALNLYPDNEISPFIVVEIGSILKNKGQYDEAIKVFVEGRNLPALRSNSTVQQDFINTIAYLRIVRNVLLQRRLGFIPYGEIPAAVLAEIDAEFREWRKLA
ncbi:tetratricopeptide repeat protein [Thermosinus carboxydivorans]|uniref:tetratricopeptide repeat protein n=1 Tax=Thermosinus carboxydivorans TaxID=261685 RepID=UPI000681F130|nr:hypothetical protein [Thermosinus carboxydivorans]